MKKRPTRHDDVVEEMLERMFPPDDDRNGFYQYQLLQILPDFQEMLINKMITIRPLDEWEVVNIINAAATLSSESELFEKLIDELFVRAYNGDRLAYFFLCGLEQSTRFQ